MKRISKKKAARDRECREFREQLIEDVDGRCEICQPDPKRVKPVRIVWRLYEHHIARGIHRSKAMGKRFAVLMLCFNCHVDRVHGNEDWPESRQLAVLLKSRPHDHNLAAYNELIGWGPERISEEDVRKWKQ